LAQAVNTESDVTIRSSEGLILKKTLSDLQAQLQHLQHELDKQKLQIEVVKKKVEETETRIIAAITNSLTEMHISHG
jgi:flagellar biosynthesis chaperone FliJ